MRTDLELPSAVYAAFRAAFLLTGNMACAEDAVFDAIELLDPASVSAARFLHQTVEFALPRANGGARICDEPTRASLDLPLELLNVLQLAPSLRCCFVLRMLLGFSVEDSARLLQLDAREMNANTCAAMQQLAAMSDFHRGAFVLEFREFASTSIM